jgi:hypothetical protein
MPAPEGLSRADDTFKTKLDEGVREIGHQTPQAMLSSMNSSGWGIPIPSQVVFGCNDVPVRGVDNLQAVLIRVSPLSELKQMFGLDLEQAPLNGGGATQSPVWDRT